jgi:hypothetical protein
MTETVETVEELRARLEQEIRAQIEAEMRSQAATAVTLAQIAEEYKMARPTVENIVTGANLTPVIKAGRTSLYSPLDIKLAIANKHENILRALGKPFIVDYLEV